MKIFPERWGSEKGVTTIMVIVLDMTILCFALKRHLGI
jgi:hypothetical protein